MDLIRLGIALFVCLVLGIAIIFLLRRHVPARRVAGSSSSVRVVETVRLGVRGALYVVEFEGQRILLAADGNGVVPVATKQVSDGATQAPAEKAE